MRGHTYKRGSTWTIVFDEPDEDGKRRQRSKGGFATKREAETFLTDTLGRIDSGSYAQPSKLTLGDYLTAEWLPAIEATLRPLSVKSYRHVISRHINPRIGSQRLQGLSGGHLNALYAQLEQQGLSVSTRRLTHAIMHRALRDAVRWGRVPRNAADMADPPARGHSRAQSWTAGELRRFLEHVTGDRLFALWRLAATTGMRRGELAGLTWRALDLDRARLSVEQQLIPTLGGATFGPPKSARSRRTIALDPETVNALGAHRDAQLLERAFAGDAYARGATSVSPDTEVAPPVSGDTDGRGRLDSPVSPDTDTGLSRRRYYIDQDLVFADPLGGPIHPNSLTAAFAKHRRAAGIPTGTLHILRHTAATLALTATPPVPVHIVAARLGDAPTEILKTYAHLLPQSDELAAERIAAALAQ
jgi:integrase